MKETLNFRKSKERFIAPRVTQAVGLDPKEALLTGSADFDSEVITAGHETDTYTLGDYWE